MDDMDNKTEETTEEETGKNAKERLYDKVPLSYRQVDILTKILVGVFVLLMLYFIISSKVWGGM